MTRIRTHPGEVLREEYLIPLGLSARALAKLLSVPANRITAIIRGGTRRQRRHCHSAGPPLSHRPSVLAQLVGRARHLQGAGRARLFEGQSAKRRVNSYALAYLASLSFSQP